MIRTKEQWEEWFTDYRRRLSEEQLFELNQSEELARALDQKDYFEAYERVLEIVNWY